MNRYDLYAALAQYLSWPVVALILTAVIIGYFGPLIRSRFPFIKSLRMGQFSIEIAQEKFDEGIVQIIDKNTESMNPQKSTVDQSTEAAVPPAENLERQKAIKLGETYPWAGILLAWYWVEREINRIIASSKELAPDGIAISIVDNKATSMVASNLDLLRREKLISSDLYERINSMQNVRNIAVHGIDTINVTPKQLASYIDSALKLVYRLQDIKV
jgi:hypothetical protein